jgi:hypothetical protein
MLPVALVLKTITYSLVLISLLIGIYRPTKRKKRIVLIVFILIPIGIFFEFKQIKVTKLEKAKAKEQIEQAEEKSKVQNEKLSRIEFFLSELKNDVGDSDIKKKIDGFINSIGFEYFPDDRSKNYHHILGQFTEIFVFIKEISEHINMLKENDEKILNKVAGFEKKLSNLISDQNNNNSQTGSNQNSKTNGKMADLSPGGRIKEENNPTLPNSPNALTHLGRTDDQEKFKSYSLDQVIETLKSKEPLDRLVAVTNLNRFNDIKSIETLMNVAYNDESTTVRQSAIHTLGRFDPIVGTLIEMLESEEIWYDAQTALLTKGSSAVTPLIECLDSDYNETSERCLQTLQILSNNDFGYNKEEWTKWRYTNAWRLHQFR